MLVNFEKKKSLAGKIWKKKSYGPYYTNFLAFWHKTGFSKTIFNTALTPFWKTYL